MVMWSFVNICMRILLYMLYKEIQHNYELTNRSVNNELRRLHRQAKFVLTPLDIRSD